MKLDLDKAEQFASLYSLGHELKLPETHEQFQVTTEMSLENNGHVYDCLVTSPSPRKRLLEQLSNGHCVAWLFTDDFYCPKYSNSGEVDKKN